MDRGKTFSAAMIEALRADRKTQTRRLATKHARAQMGAAGDRIYVREHWKTMAVHDKISPRALGRKYDASIYGSASETPIVYLADNQRRGRWAEDEREAWCPGRHRQAMHMPRWASRLTLLVQDVRIEKLQRISREDAIAEGVYPWSPFLWTPTKDRGHIAYEEPCAAYMALWNSLHTDVGQVWHDNPDVIVTTFSVVHAQIDAIDRERKAA